MRLRQTGYGVLNRDATVHKECHQKSRTQTDNINYREPHWWNKSFKYKLLSIGCVIDYWMYWFNWVQSDSTEFKNTAEPEPVSVERIKEYSEVKQEAPASTGTFWYDHPDSTRFNRFNSAQSPSLSHTTLFHYRYSPETMIFGIPRSTLPSDKYFFSGNVLHGGINAPQKRSKTRFSWLYKAIVSKLVDEIRIFLAYNTWISLYI